MERTPVGTYIEPAVIGLFEYVSHGKYLEFISKIFKMSFCLIVQFWALIVYI